MFLKELPYLGFFSDCISHRNIGTFMLHMQGGLFAGDSPYFLWLVPTLGHSMCVSIINLLYSKVAEKCTDLENHRLAATTIVQ